MSPEPFFDFLPDELAHCLLSTLILSVGTLPERAYEDPVSFQPHEDATSPDVGLKITVSAKIFSNAKLTMLAKPGHKVRYCDAASPKTSTCFGIR
nr:unnamed protein product [Spirometra erinaceieuropaei]